MGSPSAEHRHSWGLPLPLQPKKRSIMYGDEGSDHHWPHLINYPQVFTVKCAVNPTVQSIRMGPEPQDP